MKPVKKLVKQLLMIPAITIAFDMFFRLGTGMPLGQTIDSVNVRFPLYYMIMMFLKIGEQSYLGDFKTSILSGITRKNYIASQLITIILATVIATIGYLISSLIGQNFTINTFIKISVYYFIVLLIINTISTLISGFGYIYSAKKVPFIVLGVFTLIFFMNRDFFADTLPMAVIGFADKSIIMFLLMGIISSSILFFTSSKIMMNLDVK